MPSVQRHEIIIQRKILIGIGIRCWEDPEQHLTMCACVE
jgi:hypothetical protein